jgi:membrane protein DedA with SNARE-associated domain
MCQAVFFEFFDVHRGILCNGRSDKNKPGRERPGGLYRGGSSISRAYATYHAPFQLLACANFSAASQSETLGLKTYKPLRHKCHRSSHAKEATPMMEPGWVLYLGIFLGPFIQEDAAVIAAASLSAADAEHFPVIFFVILFGLFFSDIWKYWIGRAAHTSARARAYAEKEHIVDFSDKVSRHLIPTLLTARFLPLARIPVYVACGYFKVNYMKFCAAIFATALIYCTVIFVACHALGELFGDRIELIILSLGAVFVFLAVVMYVTRRALKGN